MSDVPPRPRIRPATSDDWNRGHSDRSGRGAVRDSEASAAELDTSTYYEYIQRHTGDLPLSRTRTALADRSAQGAHGQAGPPPGVPPELAEPVSQSSKRAGLKVVTVIVAIVIVLAMLAFFGVRWLAPSTGTVPVDVGGESASPSPSEELVQPSASPAEELAAYADDGTEKAADLEGSWVTQLSAKKAGMQADGRTWSAQDILNEYEANRVKYPGAILIRSEDWGSYREGGFLVTVVDTAYDSPGPALDQCRSWGLDRDHCLAKRLVRDGSPENNSAYLDG
ncbi:hypothetical protein DFO66_102161 [Brevibacterium sanguinis]|uniref:Protein kinase n=2 Tax=Brevibacterium TaxID=1696 RepID=A0A366IPT9_9MICO|nr:MULTISPECIES: protein kinase [Brevibacterium]RBP67108.1 hypothetical protein DFO66_102161 [Brevibacterium sanguinis]RBP73633.1 hypothetical protein DFO65_102161 [Brevibacterium celere]